eukprot:6224800-Pyramimonas_sp.AAC.1
MRAFALMSDGDRLEADSFKSGEGGFAVAIFKNAGVEDTMLTEIPSMYISDDKKNLLAPVPVGVPKKSARPKKKPAAAKPKVKPPVKKPAACEGEIAPP